MGWLENTTRLRTFIPNIGTRPPVVALPRTAWLRLHRLRTNVGRFRSCLHKLSVGRFRTFPFSGRFHKCRTFPVLLAQIKAPSAPYECGAEEQTVDHVFLHCSIHTCPYRVHGLMVLDDEMIEWPLNTCHKIQCGQAVNYKNWLERWRRTVHG